MLGFAPIGGSPIGSPLTSSAAGGSGSSVTAEVGEVFSLTTEAKVVRPFEFTTNFGLAMATTTQTGLRVTRTLVDAVMVSSSLAPGFGFSRSIAETFSLGTTLDYVSEKVGTVIKETVRLLHDQALSHGFVTLIAETFAVEDIADILMGAVIMERLRVQDPVFVSWVGGRAVVDGVRLADKLRTSVPVEVLEALGLDADLVAQAALRIVEKLRMSDQLVGNGSYNVSIMQTVRLRDSLARFFGADIAEAVAFADTLGARLQAHVVLADVLGISAALTPQLLLTVTARDGITLDDEQLLNTLFATEVVDGVVIEAAYVAPDGSFTAWAMNTRTAAVTEYHNFEFNSFARMGNSYLAASRAGLFELVGDDDDGLDIVARIRSGYMQFGGTQLSRLKEAYIAARGEGQMLLKIVDGDGAEYIYACDTQRMRSTKVPMGKGQRSRYFAFELTSAGQDFDLDTVEFVPIVVQRRV